MSEDGPSEFDNPESDLKKLEQLFKKVQSQYRLDKVKLVKSLLDSNYQQQTKSGKNKNILAGIIKNDHSSRQEDTSMDQFSGGVDFLMDENILTNDSREEDEGLVSRTPHNIKNMQVSNMNAINQAVVNNNGTKKMKTNTKTVNNPKASTNSVIGKHGTHA